MSVYFKTSGKKIKLSPPPNAHWELSPRPGGWFIAECFSESHGIRTSHFRKKIMVAETHNRISAHFGSNTWSGELIQEVSRGTSSASVSENDLVAQFPGKVRKIMAQVDQLVQEGDILVLIEAMKMEFPIRAPSSGKVIRMRVSEGEQISAGTKFLDWETAKNED